MFFETSAEIVRENELPYKKGSQILKMRISKFFRSEAWRADKKRKPRKQTKGMQKTQTTPKTTTKPKKNSKNK